MSYRHLFFAVSIFLFCFSLAKAEDFAENESSAMLNLKSSQGATYDHALAKAIQANPEFKPGMTKCLVAHPGKQAVHGYFRFTSATEYQVELEPRSEFSQCFAKALEGFSVPAPPSVPYFNHFTFSTAPVKGSN